MKFSIFGFLTLCASLFSMGLQAQDNIVDNSTHESFPREVSFDYNGKQYQLEATGVATRKKLIIKVYSIAHYLQKGLETSGADKMQQIMSDDTAKQFTLKWVRDVGVDKIQEAFQDSFRRVFPGQEYDQMQNEIQAFTQLFNQAAHRGDEYVFRWLPGGNIDVLINGKKVGSVANKEFAKGLWSIWIGPHSVVNSQELISLMK
jgi:hypothetical protein